ncbi:hypothetical protein QT327_06705 [Olivibacter sp. 47]|uniref:hypothetical protein n=1 Tax=Olivibacter sp. 47 TaxID=3056486 RepID=UPI0025A43B6E|nr:hypothetical protein [Olivibacter sp. 47]MDM8174044.1 hypothetical protein [Olivibacter sp. 47]
MKRGIILISFFLSIFACDKEDREDKECMLLMYVPLPSLEEVYGCTDTRYAFHIDLKETHELIRTKHTYDEKVTGSCHPAIDFEKYDLLIGRKGLKSGNHSITYELKKKLYGRGTISCHLSSGYKCRSGYCHLSCLIAKGRQQSNNCSRNKNSILIGCPSSKRPHD